MFKLSMLTMQFVLCGFLGLIAEVVFTGIADPIKNKRFSFSSSTSLWLFPVYGLLAFIYPPLHSVVKGYDWYIRGVVYMLAFFVVEYSAGWILLKVTGDYVWKYSSRFNLNGLVQLPHAPIWFLAGLGFERAYPYILKMSSLLAA